MSPCEEKTTHVANMYSQYFDFRLRQLLQSIREVDILKVYNKINKVLRRILITNKNVDDYKTVLVIFFYNLHLVCSNFPVPSLSEIFVNFRQTCRLFQYCFWNSSHEHFLYILSPLPLLLSLSMIISMSSCFLKSTFLNLFNKIKPSTIREK